METNSPNSQISTQVNPNAYLPAHLAEDNKTFTTLAVSRDFLPRLQMFGSEAKMVKRGKIGATHWGVLRGKDDELIDLGKNPKVMMLSFRYKAMLKVGDKKYETYYDPKCAGFVSTATKAAADKQAGHMVGIEFFCYLPECEIVKFATYFLCSKTALATAKDCRGALGKLQEFGSRLIETEKYTWHGPTLQNSSIPFAPMDGEQAQTLCEAFNTAPSSLVELAEESETVTTNSTSTRE